MGSLSINKNMHTEFPNSLASFLINNCSVYTVCLLQHKYCCTCWSLMDDITKTNKQILSRTFMCTQQPSYGQAEP